MKTIFDKEIPKSRFEKWMQKRQLAVMVLGLVSFAFIVLRLIFNF